MEKEKVTERGDDDGDVGCWSSGDEGGVVMVKVKMVVMGREIEEVIVKMEDL